MWAVFKRTPTKESKVVLGFVLVQAIFGAVAVLYSAYGLHLI